LQIFLVGQPELGTRLNASELRQLKQRVALRYHLRPLNLTECKDYVARRLEVANGDISLFTPGAIEFVHAYSGGIPRVVNILCDNGLLTAYALRKQSVEAAMIEEVARDLQLNVSIPLARRVGDFNTEAVPSPDRKIRTARPGFVTTSKLERNSNAVDVTANPRPGLVPTVHSVAALPPKKINYSPEAKGDTPVTGKAGSGIVSSQFLDYMIRVLTEAMGPMASVIVHEQIAAMGESPAQFPKRRLVELVEEATREILNDSAKANCKRVMLESIRGFDSGSESSSS
jgi:hypothetical protein